MADRVKRFLGAFTYGFLAIAAASILTIAGVPTANVVFPVVIFLFLGAVVYGSLELLLVIRPRPARLHPSGTIPARRSHADTSGPRAAQDAAEGDVHASR